MMCLEQQQSQQQQLQQKQHQSLIQIKTIQESNASDKNKVVEQNKINSPKLSQIIQEHRITEPTTPENDFKSQVFIANDNEIKIAKNAEKTSDVDRSQSLRIFNPNFMMMFMEKDLKMNSSNPGQMQDCGKEAQSILMEENTIQEQPNISNITVQPQQIQQQQQQQQQHEQIKDIRYLNYQHQDLIKKFYKQTSKLKSLSLYNIIQSSIICCYIVIKFVWIFYILGVLTQKQDEDSNQNIRLIEDSSTTQSALIYTNCAILALQVISLPFCKFFLIKNLRKLQIFKRMNVVVLKMYFALDLIFFAFILYYQFGFDSKFKIIAGVFFIVQSILLLNDIQLYTNIYNSFKYCTNVLNVNPFDIEILN